MSKRSRNEDGNSVAAAATLTRMLVRVGETLSRADDLVDRVADEDVFILDIRFKVGGSVSDGWLVVLRADSPEGKLVAFHDAPTFLEAVQGTFDRLQNRSLKWKEDRPYGS